MQHRVEQWQRDDHRQAGQQHRRREDGVLQRDHAHQLFHRMTRRRDQHRDAGRQAEAVQREAAVGGGDDQRIVDALDLQRQLARDDAADHQSEAPVQIAADAADQRGDDHRAARRGHAFDDAIEETVDQRRGRQHVAHRKDHGHLRGERQQVPEALAPFQDHGGRGLPLHQHGHHHAQQRQSDGKNKGVRQIPAHQFSKEPGDLAQDLSPKTCRKASCVAALVPHFELAFYIRTHWL